MKSLSLKIVTLWYALALVVPLYINQFYSPFLNIWLEILFLHIIATVIIYIGSIIHKNSSLYDPFWSVAPIPIVLYFCMFHDTNISIINSLLITIPILIWAIRLTRNWVISWPGFIHEDFRYVDLKKGNKFRLEFINFTGIHLIPTLQVNVSLLPIYFLFTSNNLDNISYLLLFASLFSIFAVIIETIADEQMREFRKNKLNKGKTMNKGLWRLSRHPNYFGEVMFWVGLYLMAILTVETPLWLLVSPVSMIMLFVFISCPMMDNRSLKNRHDYKDYMDTTPQLFLWFPKK